MLSGVRLKVYVQKENDKITCRLAYIPATVYKMLGEPDELILEEIDIKKGTMTLKAVRR